MPIFKRRASVQSNELVSLAPGEGQIPTSIYYQPDWETMAFPTHFPSGKNGYDCERDVPLTVKITFIVVCWVANRDSQRDQIIYFRPFIGLNPLMLRTQ